MSCRLAYAWSLIFAFFTAIGIAFQDIRGYSVGTGGLFYIGPILGSIFAFFFLFHDNHIYNQAIRRTGHPIPETRLYYGAAGGILAAIGMFIFTFTAGYTWVHWIAPEIGLVLVLMGISFIFNSVQCYLSDFYGKEHGASAIAGQGFVRNAMAASFPLFTSAMFYNLGFQYAGLLLSLLITIAIPLPFILIWRGPQIRARSKYAAGPEDEAEESKSRDPVLGARRDLEKASPAQAAATPSSGMTTRVPTPEPAVQSAKQPNK